MAENLFSDPVNTIYAYALDPEYNFDYNIYTGYGFHQWGTLAGDGITILNIGWQALNGGVLAGQTNLYLDPLAFGLVGRVNTNQFDLQFSLTGTVIEGGLLDSRTQSYQLNVDGPTISAFKLVENVLSGSPVLPRFSISSSFPTQTDIRIPTPKLVASASSGRIITSGVDRIPMMSVVAEMREEGQLAGSAVLPVMRVVAAASFGSAATTQITLPILGLSSSAVAGRAASLSSVLPALSLSAAGINAPQILISNAIELAFIVHGDFLQSAGTGVSVPRTHQDVLVLNLKNGAFTTWDWTTFSAIAASSDGSRIFAVAPDGLYEISHAHVNDVTSNVAASFRTGVTGMESDFGKRLTSLWLLCSANGPLRVTAVTGDSEQYPNVMENVRYEDVLHMARVKTGRGVMATRWGVKVESLDGADFRIGKIAFDVEETSRRFV